MRNLQLALIFFEKTNELKCHYCKISKQMETKCKKCNSPIIKLLGAGTEKVEKELKKKFPRKTILKIDSQSETPVFPEGDKIIIGTKKAFKQIDWCKTNLILFLNIDLELSLPEFNAQEQVWHLIKKIQYLKNKEAKFIIQTNTPEQTIFKSQKEPDRFYRTDLNSRKSLLYPPYSFICRYIITDKEQEKTQKKAEKVQNTIKYRLTKEKNECILMNPLPTHPSFYRGRYGYVIILKIKLNENREKVYNAYKCLMEINYYLSNDCKIDPNPISLLSN